jgi:hypothetical protein
MIGPAEARNAVEDWSGESSKRMEIELVTSSREDLYALVLLSINICQNINVTHQSKHSYADEGYKAGNGNF